LGVVRIPGPPQISGFLRNLVAKLGPLIGSIGVHASILRYNPSRAPLPTAACARSHLMVAWIRYDYAS